MKVLQINNVYRFGSTGKITADIHEGLLKRGIDSCVYYGRRDLTGDENVHKVCSEVYGKMQNVLSRFTGLMYGGCMLSTSRIIRAIRRERPDVVHLQCLNGYFVNVYRLVQFLKKEQIPTVLTLHAEFMHTANCGHALDCEKWKQGCGHCPRLRQETLSLLFDRTAESFRKMKAAFDGFDRLTVASVSPWLMERAKQSPIFRDKHHCVVLNGLDTCLFRYADGAAARAELGIAPDSKVVLHVTPDFSADENHLKGGYYVLRLAERMPDVQFWVAGPCRDQDSAPANVHFLGSVSDREKLAQLYSAADVTLLTSKRETFSMVCAESLCCGTPVAGFCAGAPEKISLPSYSAFVPHGQLDALMHAVEKLLGQKWDAEIIAREAAAVYDQEKMVEAYMACYCALMK